MIVITPKPPYYAVIFSTLQTDIDEGYIETADRVEALAQKQKGYLGIESVRTELGITVLYWKSLEAIKQWHAKELKNDGIKITNCEFVK